MGLKYKLKELFRGPCKVNSKRLYEQLEDISGFGECNIHIGDFVFTETPQVVFDLENKRIILWDGSEGGVIEASPYTPDE